MASIFNGLKVKMGAVLYIYLERNIKKMVQNLQRIKAYNNLTNHVDTQKENQSQTLSQVRKKFVEQVMDKIHGIDFASEEEREKFQAKIEYKIKSGSKLSQKEMNYLRKYNPYMYQQMVRVQQKREMLKQRLKNCRTKEEAHWVIGETFSSISDKDPVREAMVAAIQNVSIQFCSSETYKKLPDTEEELRKTKKVEKAIADPFEQDKEDSGDDRVYETIRYSFSSMGYQEATVGVLTENSSFDANG